MRKNIYLLSLLALFQISCGSSGGGDPGLKTAEKPSPEQAMELCPPNAPAGSCRSFLMSLRGRNGQPLNANVKTAIAGAIGSLVKQMKIKNYILLEEYSDGGFRVCLDPVANGGYEAAVGEFSTYSVGSQNQWDITEIKSCTGGR